VPSLIGAADGVDHHGNLADHTGGTRERLGRVPALEIEKQRPPDGAYAQQRDDAENYRLAHDVESGEGGHGGPHSSQGDEAGDQAEGHHLPDCKDERYGDPGQGQDITSTPNNAPAQNLVVTSEEMRARVAGAPVGRLATLGPDGAPRLVPICFVLAGEVVYSAVDHKPKRTSDLGRLRNVARDPRVCVLIDHYENDWSRLWWIRLDGVAQTLGAGAEAADALAHLIAKYDQYRREPPPGPVLKIEIRRWKAWTSSATK
jgi:PPOX class probable F420-dependent enzyme